MPIELTLTLAQTMKNNKKNLKPKFYHTGRREGARNMQKMLVIMSPRPNYFHTGEMPKNTSGIHPHHPTPEINSVKLNPPFHP